MLRFAVIIGLLFIIITTLIGQDSIKIYGNEIVINDSAYIASYTFSSFQKVDGVSNESISESLSNSTGVFIQNGGPALLATALNKGLGARHMAILWNGENVQSPINGTFDLSLIPSSIFSKSLFTSSPLTALYGSGSMAGGIILETSYQKQISFGYHLNSSNNKDYTWEGNADIGKSQHKISLHLADHSNSYTYNKFGVESQMRDASFNNFNLQYNASLPLKTSVISWAYWGQTANRNIPVSKTSAQQDIHQLDLNHRVSVKYDKRFSNFRNQIKFTFFDEKLVYNDPGVYSRADNQTFIFRNNLYWQSMGSQLSFSIRNDKINANFFLNEIEEQRLSIQLSQPLKITNKLQASFNAKYEWTKTKVAPYALQITTEWQQSNNLKLRASFGRHFNLPTYNDRYWPGAGNPDLLPEVGYLTEIGFQWLTSPLKFNFSTFYNQVNDWILWSPQNNGIWQPSNQRKVRSYGLNSDINSSWQFSSLGISTQFSYNFTLARIAEDTSLDALVGKQLIYIPKHKVAIISGLKFHSWSSDLSAQYVSKRYSTTDNMESVKGYFLFNIQLKKEIHFTSQTSTNVFVGISNLTNTDYEVIKYFATPLRQWNAGLKINL